MHRLSFILRRCSAAVRAALACRLCSVRTNLCALPVEPCNHCQSPTKLGATRHGVYRMMCVQIHACARARLLPIATRYSMTGK
ncbi:hypothetical protein BD626DRAFT_500017 [Schizophyllum amplum]|uniref:Secreted protein n=1 Tax=Schizophyllum amplum TaxID=97359 RepID=A0A550CBF0_9AGAR|nr:hypothetical protein BD626DRAFT_500017 [Auriculariopsis ampla]